MVNADAVQNRIAEAQLEDAFWLQRCREGDQAAISMLITRHRDRLIRTAANVLRDRHEAEDVAQESFIKAIKELHRLREDRAFAGYIYRICIRLCMDRLRARKPEPAEFNAVEGSPSGQIEDRLLIEKLLKKLSAEQRMTLVLREMEQLNYDEIAEVMHVPVGTVRSRLHNARDRFRELWISATRETR